MIKVISFQNMFASDVDTDLETFLNDVKIKRECIIDINSWAATSEDGVIYHYARLVYNE